MKKNESDQNDFTEKKIGRNEKCPCGSGKNLTLPQIHDLIFLIVYKAHSCFLVFNNRCGYLSI